MLRTEINEYRFNSDLRERVRGQSIDFCHLFALAIEGNLSVTARYDPPSGEKRYVTLNGDLQIVDAVKSEDWYYGVSPKMDNERIIKAISALQMTDLSGLDAFIAQNADLFMLHADQGKYLLDFARYLVVSYASNFAVSFIVPEEKRKELLPAEGEGSPAVRPDGCVVIRNASSKKPGPALSRYRFAPEQNGVWKQREDGVPLPAILGDGDSCVLVINRENDGSLIDLLRQQYQNDLELCCLATIKGCPTRELLKSFDSLSLRFTKEGNGLWTASENGKTVQEVYSEPGNITLANNSVFYSGVLFKPCFFENQDDRHENKKITSICIHFERSTYATVFALDHNNTDHPLIAPVRQGMVEFLKNDDRAKAELIAGLEGLAADNRISRRALDAINEYLGNCSNVNQIGVSGNLITCDKVLLMGKRGSHSIDSGCLYPGVNGNAELADRNVSFYSTSMYEDYPTARLSNDRIDFLGEISREAYAELKVDLPRQDWICHGITISGNRPVIDGTQTQEYAQATRRMHFNILFEQRTEKSFREIEESSLAATEAFENSCMLGVRAEAHKNLPSMIAHRFRELLEYVSSLNDEIQSVLLLLVVFLSIGGFKTAIDGWYSVASLVLSIVVVSSMLVKLAKTIKQWIHKRQAVRKAVFYQSMNTAEKDRQLEKLTSGYQYHPVAYAALKAYVDNLLYEAYFGKDRRDA